MALSFGTLVFLSVGGVLALSVGANYRNTFDLLGAQSTLLVDAMEDALRAEMGGAENAVDGVAQLYAQGEFQIDDEPMAAALAGTLSATREATALLICTPDLVCRGAARSADDGAIQRLPAEAEKSPQVLAALAQRKQVEGRQWGAFVANEYGLFAHVSAPLTRDGATQAWVIAAVRLQKLSEITQELSSRFGTHAFILDGDGSVLADPRLADANALKNGIQPLMPLATFGDPVLAAYGGRKAEAELGTGARPRYRGCRDPGRANRTAWDGDNTYIAITRKIAGYGDQPWTIGAYFESSQINDEIERVMGSALLGLAGDGGGGHRGDPAWQAPGAPDQGDRRPGHARCRFRP